MSGQVLLILALIGWVSVGPALSVVMGRRGHSPAAWGVIGMFLGPMAVPLALDASWRRHRAVVSVLSRQPPGGGPVSLLVAIDGSPEATAALGRAAMLFGDRIGRLTLVHVPTYDAAADPAMLTKDEALARRWMSSAREATGVVATEEVVLPGRPAEALVRFAVEGGYDVIVAGSRGRGMSPRLFGSVARGLAGSSPVPVLIGGQEPTPEVAAALRVPAATATLERK